MTHITVKKNVSIHIDDV